MLSVHEHILASALVMIKTLIDTVIQRVRLSHLA